MNLLQKMLKDPAEIQQFLSQRAPFVFVDRLFYVDKQSAITGFTPTKKTIFAESGFFTESGIIEHMAQSISLKNGFLASHNTKPGEVYFGVLAALQNLCVFERPLLGISLKTHVQDLHDFGSMRSSEVSVYQEETALKVAHGILKTAIF